MSENVNRVKEEILQLIIDHFGSSIAKTFVDLYDQEALPIYTDGALKVLEGFIGEEKA